MTRIYFVRTKMSGKPVSKYKSFPTKDKAFGYAKKKSKTDFGIDIIR
ncbi:hypothetical protein LCGC14_2296720 [marine sediment metagenome]|uniref:Uncharacterized protein n=1 Tax=marine sediment metagenome TaxID=412755 RepID=A0A0F9F256_9ZZZZ